MVLALPPHKVTRKREHGRIDRHPSEQYPKIQAQSRVKIEQDLATGLDDRVQRPRVAPVVEVRLDSNVVKSRRDIRDDPEDEPHPRPVVVAVR